MDVNNLKIKKLLKENRFLELRRKSIHIVFGVFFCYLIYFNKFSPYFWLGILFLGILLSFILKKYQIPWLSKTIISFEREAEIKKYPLKGALSFIFGCILSYLLFATPNSFCRLADSTNCKLVAISAIITLFIGDSLAALYGKYFGKISYQDLQHSSHFTRKLVSLFSPEKHLDASILSIIFNTIFIAIFFPFWKALLVSSITFLVESIDFKTKNPFVDDNIYLPIISGIILIFL